MFSIPSLNSLVPTSIWPGKRKVPMRSEATIGEFERYDGWAGLQLEYQDSTGFSAILHGQSFKRPYSLSDPGVERG